MSTTKTRGWWLAAGATALLALGACQKDPEPPAPAPPPVTLPPPATVAEPVAATASGVDHPVVQGSAASGSTSVPSADATLSNTAPPASAADLNAPFDQKNDLSRQQERSAMPLPGQTNDHSTTTGPKKAP